MATKAANHKKQRLPDSKDITRFFGRAEQDAAAHPPARDELPAPHTLPPGLGAAPADHSQADGIAAATPALSALHKHLTALQDMRPADSFAMSQDTDAMQVVWHDSPGDGSSHARPRSFSMLGRTTSTAPAAAAAPTTAAATAAAGGPTELTAIKQRIISVAQKPRDTRRLGAAPVGHGGRMQSEQFLEGLLARQGLQQPNGGGTSQQQKRIPGETAAPEYSAQSGAPSDTAAGMGGPSHCPSSQRTPGTHLRGILKRPVGGGGSGGRSVGGTGGKHTPASSVKFCLRGSSGRRKPGAAPHSGSGGRQRHAGQKRKALLDLLEQVELTIVQPAGEAEQQGQQQAEQAVSPRDALCGAAAAGASVCGDPGTMSDKENSADGGSRSQEGAAGVGAAAAAASAYAGPTGSQQLMPPPGGVRCCGELPAKQPQGPAAAGAAVGARGPVGTTAAAAAAAAGSSVLQVKQARPGTAKREHWQAGGSTGGGSGGKDVSVATGGGKEADADDADDDDDDALMAQLELELLAQVERQQAAARHGPAPAAPAPPHGWPAAGRQHSQGAPHLPQSAPPPAQHPAAVQQLAQQQQRQAAAGQLKSPPRSALHKRAVRPAQRPASAAGAPASPPARSAAPAVALAAEPAGPEDDACEHVPAVPAAVPPVPVPCQLAPASDSDWGDDGLDADLLDQFESAAFQQHAQRSAAGHNPAGGGASGGTSGSERVATGGGERPPVEPARWQAPVYPGDRAEVYYEIREVHATPHEQVLLLHNKYQDRSVYAHLQAPWADLPYRVDDAVNLLADLDMFDGHLHCELTLDRGMLVLHPDLLLSGTRITTSHECPRRSFLDERVAGDGSNDKAVKGTLTHNLIQAALTEGLRSTPQLVGVARRVVAQATEALLEVQLSEEAALECLRAAVPGIQRWMHRFLRPCPAPDSLLGAGMDYSSGRDIQRLVAVREVLDIEESIWSTKYGVKGMIDISAQLALDEMGNVQRGRGPPSNAAWMQAAGVGAAQHNGQQQQQQGQQQGQQGQQGQQAAAPPAQPGRQLTVAPVEIKTGKAHDSHRAQVLLYLLLMEERYGRPLDWGMLWYTTQTDPLLVLKRPAELSCLMAVRNRLAAAIAHKEMPELADEKRQCNWCFQQLNCALAFKAQGGGAATADAFVRPSTDRGGGALDGVQQELGAKYERAAGHMTAADCEFLRSWEALVTLEEGQGWARRPEIWAMAAKERQRLGRCVAGLALSQVDEQQLLYTFCRPDGGATDCSFSEGEMLLLSVEGQHTAVARGFFHACTATHLTVSLNKALRRGLLQPEGSAAAPHAAALPAAGAVPAVPVGGPQPAFDAAVRWRLDRDEVSSTFVRLRGNLFALFRRQFESFKDPQTNRTSYGGETLESQHAAKLRRLVVALQAPAFLPSCHPSQPEPTPSGMNSEQHAAVSRVLAAEDYTLVLGMPGSGKTTTIVSMVQALVAQGKRVLLTSYTNSAVDNILMKLAAQGVPFVRLGREAGVHPAVRPWVPGGARYPLKTTRELARLADCIPVFGATCFGVNHPMLRGRLFDVCIIDEAGQMVLPAALGPLLCARTFVLVGDHNQLPPLVTCKEAEAGGMGESLFKRLSEAHPSAVVTLPVQYRMAADIMALPNALIYNDALRCGTDGVAQAALQLPAAAAAVVAALPRWLQAVLDPQRRVLFLDTAAVQGARESVAGDALCNGGEAVMVVQLLQAAVAAGVPQEQIGVISPYRSQVALLGRLSRGAALEGVEVLTVDKCQGRDKDFIAVSLVRSNAEGEAGKLLADWRRINVAITRARCKLVLLGDAACLSSIPLFARLVGLVRERGWYLQLPVNAAAAQQGEP